MKRLSHILLLLLPFIASCENVIEFKGSTTESLLVLNCIAHDGDSVRVRVSHSIFFLDSSTNGSVLPDATVTISINGQEARALYDEDYKSYFDPRIVHEGDHIVISATHSKYGSCRGETTVPYKTSVTASYDITPYGGWTKVSYTPDIINFARTDSVAHVTFKFHLPEGDNFYRLTLEPSIHCHLHNLNDYVGGGDWWDAVADAENGEGYSAKKASYIIPTSTRMKLGINGLEGLFDDLEIELTDDERFVSYTYEILFTDEYLKNSGEQSLLFNIMLSTPFWWYGSDYYYDPTKQPDESEQEYVKGNPWDYLDPGMQCQVKLRLETLTPGYYHYITSSESYENTEYDIFAEPVQIYSNIEGGIGIVASSTVSETILTIPYHFNL